MLSCAEKVSYQEESDIAHRWIFGVQILKGVLSQMQNEREGNSG